MGDRLRQLRDGGAKAAVVGALALVGVVAAWPGTATLALQVAAISVAAAAAATAVRRFVDARVPAPATEPDDDSVDPVADEYERLRRQVEVAMQPGAGLDAFLVRELREIAGRLLLRRGIELHRDPERARRLVGDETWELIRPGHRTTTLGATRLLRALDRLEAL